MEESILFSRAQRELTGGNQSVRSNMGGNGFDHEKMWWEEEMGKGEDTIPWWGAICAVLIKKGGGSNYEGHLRIWSQ
jgi:hypothetical protein